MRRLLLFLDYRPVCSGLPLRAPLSDEYFDHCRYTEVPPSDPRRTRRFPVATIFSHWIVCFECRSCPCRCYLDQERACSRSLTFGSLIPRLLSLWQPAMSWIFAVGRQVCRHPIFVALHFTLCFRRLLCGNHLLLNRRTLSKDDWSANLWA